MRATGVAVIMMLTYKNTYWNSVNTGYKKYPSLNSNQECDVVIVGGGISGCLTAYYLSQYNINTILIEKNLIGHESTLSNNGFLHYETDTSLIKLINFIGEEKAFRAYTLCKRAIDNIENIIYNLKQYCDFERKDNIHLCDCKNNCSLLKKEFKLRKKFGFNVEYMTQSDIKKVFSISYPCGIYSKNCATVDPLKLCYALLKSATLKNSKIYENTKGVSCDYYKNSITVNTNTDYHITCKNIVFANDYESLKLIKNSHLVSLKTAYSISTNPIIEIEKFHKEHTFNEGYDMSFQIRPTSDNRLLAQYVNTNFHEKNTYNIILNKLKTVFPYIENLQIDYHWKELIGKTSDSLPIIGRHPTLSNCYLNLPFGKNKICYSLIGAEIIKDLILYNSNPDSEIFTIKRKHK